MKSKGQFRLDFACVKVRGMDAQEMRALVLAVSEIPGSKTHVLAGLALENGAMIQKPIPKIDFELGQRNGVTLIEVADVQGIPTAGIVGPDGRKVAGG